MQYTDRRHHLRVAIDAKGCDIPADERTRMERTLGPLGEEVRDLQNAELTLGVTYHKQSKTYNVEARLRLPGRSLVTSDRDGYLDSAYQRCVRKLYQLVKAYQEHPDRKAEKAAERRASLDDNVVSPEDPDAGPLLEHVRAGKYMAFRNDLVLYEDFLRKRVGRWIQRYPEAEARVGDGLKIGDLVEEVYLNAFEHFPERPDEVSLSAWLDQLIDPSLKALLRHPDEERENASFARTLREAPPHNR
jgi:ribosome-associated translation inhibitor RaiA